MSIVNYPVAIDTWTDKVDRVEIYQADHINEAHARIIKIQQVLGLNPQAAFSTVANRIAAIAAPPTPFLQTGEYDFENIQPSGLYQTIEASVTL